MDLARFRTLKLVNGARVEEVEVDPEQRAGTGQVLVRLGDGQVVREIRPSPRETTEQDDERAAS